MKRRFILIGILVNVIFSNLVFAQASQNVSPIWGSGDVFKCDPVLDSVLFGTGALIYGTDLLLEKGFKYNQKKFDGEILDKNSVNAFDRFFMQPYSKPLDTTADVLMITMLASPAILLATQPTSDWMTIGMMYAESVLLAQGIKEISKLFINRPRPYMYYEGFPEKDVYEKLDWNNSCPSGHSTMAFMSATFLTYVFCQYHPDTLWQLPVIIGSYAFATTTAALRVASGNHFVTDVLFGSLIGSAVGFLVPFLHTLTSNKYNSSNSGRAANRGVYVSGATVLKNNSIEIGISPYNIDCLIRF